MNILLLRLYIWFSELFSNKKNYYTVRYSKLESNSFLTILEHDYQWSKLAKTFIKTHNTCVLCTTLKNLEVHHKKPWQLFPDLRYNEKNLITLCRECHFRFGHCLNWKNYNDKIEELSSVIKYYLIKK